MTNARDWVLVLLVTATTVFVFRLLAYCLAGRALVKAFDGARTSALSVAFVRVVIGFMGAWLLFGVLLPHVPGHETPVGEALSFLALFVVRTLSWWLTIQFFFDKAKSEPKRAWMASFVGALYSHFIDLPMWLALYLVFGAIGWLGAV